MNKTFIAISIVVFVWSSCSFGQICQSNEPTAISIVPTDQVWLVSARDFDKCVCPTTDLLDCQRFCSSQCHWTSANCTELANSNFGRDMQTVVFVHGYQTDMADAQKRGLQVYQNLFGNCRCSGPIRFVIWAWRSEKECRRPVVDFNLKAMRAVGLGDIFALTLNKLGPRSPIVIGYSLGAQVAVSGLAKSTLYQGQPIRFAVIAPANDCGFASCCNQMHVCGNIERSLIFLNDGDRAIRAANLICKLKHGKHFRPFEELAVEHSDNLGEINIVNISEVASVRHSIVKYTALPVVKVCIEQLIAESSPAEDLRPVYSIGQHFDDGVERLIEKAFSN